MRMPVAVAVGSLAVALLLQLAACTRLTDAVRTAINPPRLTGVTPRITGIDFAGVDLALDLQVENTLPVAIVAPRFRYALELAGRQLLAGTRTSGVNLPAAGSGVATLPLRLAYADLYTLATELKEVPETDYRVSGAFLVSAMGQDWELPFAHAGKVPVLKLPAFSDIRTGAPTLSGGRAQVTVTAAVCNPNIFALGIEDMGYAVQLGEVRLGGVRATTGSSIAAQGSGTLRLTGELSALDAVAGVLGGASAGAVRIVPTGSVVTPYGTVALPAGD